MTPLKWVVFLLIFFLGQIAGMSAGEAAEKTLKYRFNDGAGIEVHFTEGLLKKSGEAPSFPREVLDAAVLAYQTIVQIEGFSADGYSFAKPDLQYAYDPDRTIDIFLGSPTDNAYASYGIGAASFRDAPCFDTIPVLENQFQAVILLPINYREFIRNWEKINPSPLGKRNIDVDLRGTLAHEMLHAILFYYNKNLNKEVSSDQNQGRAKTGKVDWYVEGLARYFETLVGAKHDFFSQGFKEILPDKVRFSRGGSNYFMRYPDQAFTELRYENALFWRFIDYRKGMKQIEFASRNFRGADMSENLEEMLEKLTGMKMPQLLGEFSEAILFKDFGLKDSESYLKDVARTHLVYDREGFYLLDGFGKRDFLGRICRTDWIGEWGETHAALGDFSAAGDNTPESDVSAWATDYCSIEFSCGLESLPWIGVMLKEGGKPLMSQLFLVTQGGGVIHQQISEINVGQTLGWSLQTVVEKEGLRASDIEKAYVLVTNADPCMTASYAIVSSPAKFFQQFT